jgi:hypothetical protein
LSRWEKAEPRFSPMASTILIALVWLALTAEPAAAWGPATHVALGQAVLGSLYILPPAIRLILERHPLHFL